MVIFSVSVGLCSPLSPLTKVGNPPPSPPDREGALESNVPSRWSSAISASPPDREGSEVGITTRHPGSNISLPVTLNSMLSTSPSTVVVENLQSGRKTPMKRRATRSNTFRSASLNPCGMTPVGMMAWWSVTFDESNTRLVFFSGLPPMGLMSSA